MNNITGHGIMNHCLTGAVSSVSSIAVSNEWYTDYMVLLVYRVLHKNMKL